MTTTPDKAEPRKAAPNPTPNQEGEPVQKQTNEKILTTAANALGWTVIHTTASRTNPDDPATYMPARLFERGESRFMVFLGDIQSDTNEAREAVGFALRLLAENDTKDCAKQLDDNTSNQTGDSKAICAALDRLTATYEANNRITQDAADQMGEFFSRLNPAQDPDLERAKVLIEDHAKRLDNDNDESELLRYLRLQSKERGEVIASIISTTDYALKLLAAFGDKALKLERKRLKRDKTAQDQTNDALRLSIKALCERVEKVEKTAQAPTNDVFRYAINALSERVEKVEHGTNISAEYLDLLKDSEARTRERIEAVVDAIQGNPEEGKGLVTNGQLYGEITDLKIEMDNARARELDAIKAEMGKIKADLRTLFNNCP